MIPDNEDIFADCDQRNAFEYLQLCRRRVQLLYDRCISVPSNNQEIDKIMQEASGDMIIAQRNVRIAEKEYKEIINPR